MNKAGARPAAARGVTFDDVRTMALALEGVEESTSYGTAAFKVRGKLLARLREDGETLVVRIDMDAREMLIDSDPETFFFTDHYANYPAVLVRMPRVAPAALAALLEEARRTEAPPKRAPKKPASTARKTAPPEPAPAKRPLAKPAAAKKVASTKEAAFERVRALCLGLAGVTEATNHSRPCFEVRGKTFVMFMDDHHGDGRLALWCKAPPGAQGALVESDPARFFVPPYVGPRGWVGVRLDVGGEWGLVAACVEEGYRMTAAPPPAKRRR